jgi:3-oxosteroid 1-dehydrogenase
MTAIGRIECDVLVAGSGAGALAAAARAHDLGLRVAVIEKAAVWGGTSAISGGAIWAPNNRQIGDRDSREKALTYLQACTGGLVSPSLLEAYVDQSPRAAAYLERIGVRLRANMDYPDYRPDLPGALSAGRTLDPEPFDAALLGKTFATLRDQLPFMKVFGRISLSSAEGRALSQRRPGWMGLLAKMLAGYWLDVGWRLKTARGRRLTMGAALVASLRKALLDRQVPVHLGVRLTTLRQVEGGHLVLARRGEDDIEILARRGVVLAAGGFEHDGQLRARHLPPGGRADHSPTPAGQNTGDALKAGMDLGATTDGMANAWWAPAMRGPMGGEPDAVYVLFMERAYPGGVILNKRGRRFANEAQSYNDFGLAMIDDQVRTGGASDCWLIFDAGYRRRYMVGPMMAGAMAPDCSLPKAWLGKVYHRADSLQALAGQIGLDPQVVAASVARFNIHAERGLDPDFGRGGNVYDQYFGDQTFDNPNLAPVDAAPFYAVRIVLGDLGTKGGLKVDANANVLGQDDQPIAGLYAIGNTAASMMGAAYPGAGGTLGPAITFGVVAAEHIARRSNQPPR